MTEYLCQHWDKPDAACRMLRPALDYASHGIPVFPCRPDKRPCTVHGFQDAATDRETLVSWWVRNPGAMIGMPTGSLSGLIALDLDRDPAHGIDGESAFATRMAERRALPINTRTHRTPRGGIHLLFEHPGERVKTCASQLAPGVDVRGDGGYVILPPSESDVGVYMVEANDEPQPLPPWLRDLLRERGIMGSPDNTPEKRSRPIPVKPDAGMLTPYVHAAIEEETQAVATTPVGQRNDRLNKAAFALGQFVGAGALRRDTAEGALADAARDCGLPAPEAAKTIRSGLDAGIGDPREMPGSTRNSPIHTGAGNAHASYTGRRTALTSWPATPDEACYHGLAGDIVRALDPHTEADPVAVLTQLLVFFGNCVGRDPHFLAEADRHAVNEFALLVGETSKGRKGTSAGHVRRLFADVDSVWAENRLQSGLSSGEGLVWAVRDPITRPGKGGQPELVDPGEADRRLLAVESEFASTLHAIERQGNTLSAAIRNLWDSGTVRTLTKNSPARTTDAHVSLVGHITRDELLRYMTRTELANGFANRFLFLCVRRSKILPEGGNIQDATLQPLVHRLKEAVQHARTVNEIKRDSDARELWIAVYPKLSEGKKGLLGGILSRSEAHTMRLACIYALLDQASEIQREHLTAALALWGYIEQSAAWVFGDSIGDPEADTILRQLRLRPEGLTRTEINDLFRGHRRTQEIERAMTLLTERGYARCEKVETGGRHAERWVAT